MVSAATEKEDVGERKKGIEILGMGSVNDVMQAAFEKTRHSRFGFRPARSSTALPLQPIPFPAIHSSLSMTLTQFSPLSLKVILTKQLLSTSPIILLYT